MYRNRRLRGGVLGVFASGADGGTPDQYAPSYNPYAPAGPNYTPGPAYPGPTYGPEYRPELLGPEYGPEYRPELMSQPLPAWVVPTAVGAGAFVLLGGLGLVLGKRRRRR